MGNELTNIAGQDNRVIIQPADTDGKGTGNGNGSNSTSTTSTGTGGGTGGSGSGTGSGTGTAETVKGEKVPELALLTEEEKASYLVADESEKKRIMRNAKKRQRYAEKKKESGQPVKPRKVKSTKKESEPTMDVTQLNIIVASVSTVVASRPNCEHWLLNEQEINSITVPLSKMLAESQAFTNMGQYSNQIALCMACITVFMPRLIVTVQKNKEVKKIARTGQTSNTNVKDERIGTAGKEKNSNPRSNRGNDKQLTADGKNNADNVPFYGVPIC